MTKVSLKGHVYVLESRNSKDVKIGGTDHPPMKRLKEINNCEPYASLGPWGLHDFRQVSDWRAVEAHLHYMFRDFLVADVDGQRELFRITPERASAALNALDPDCIVGKPKIDRMFQDESLSSFLQELFVVAGLSNWLDAQGAWVFALFPATAGGRYFTLSIGMHEVAFSGLPFDEDGRSWHMLLVDELICDFPEVAAWLKDRDGEFRTGVYKSERPRAVSCGFRGSLADAREFLQLPGVRRALIAYWVDALYELKERNRLSFFARFHNWNAVAELARRVAAAGT